jgi:sulfite exporter TauE/SafE
MSFGLYVVGAVIVICGLVYGAAIMHVASHWIVVGAIVLLGLAILTGVKATRQKDPSGS